MEGITLFDTPLPEKLEIGVVTKEEFCPLPQGFSPDEPLFVLTDIHGSTKALKVLLDNKPADTRLVFLGDAVDRGPDPLGTIRIIMDYPNVVCLRGNHDAMAWFSQEGVEPTNDRIPTWWSNNGGTRTSAIFERAIDEEGYATGKIATKTPQLFEDYWLQGKNWWLSGNILFVHGCYPKEKDEAWLNMDPLKATYTEESPYWWRFRKKADMYHTPSYLGDKPVFVVNGHTPMRESLTLMPYGINLDRGYQRKMAAEIRPAAGDEPAKVRFIATDCDEVDKGRRREIPDFEDYFF